MLNDVMQIPRGHVSFTGASSRNPGSSVPVSQVTTCGCVSLLHDEGCC